MSDRPTFRLLETEPASAPWNMALDAVLLEGCGRKANEPSPPTIRLLRFSPPAVLIGAYQTVEAEVRVDYRTRERDEESFAGTRRPT